MTGTLVGKKDALTRVKDSVFIFMLYSLESRFGIASIISRSYVVTVYYGTQDRIKCPVNKYERIRVGNGDFNSAQTCFHSLFWTFYSVLVIYCNFSDWNVLTFSVNMSRQQTVLINRCTRSSAVC